MQIWAKWKLYTYTQLCLFLIITVVVVVMAVVLFYINEYSSENVVNGEIDNQENSFAKCSKYFKYSKYHLTDMRWQLLPSLFFPSELSLVFIEKGIRLFFHLFIALFSTIPKWNLLNCVFVAITAVRFNLDLQIKILDLYLTKSWWN